MIPHDAGLPDPAGPLPPPHRDLKPVAGRVEPAPPALPPTPPPALSAGPDLAGPLRPVRLDVLGGEVLHPADLGHRGPDDPAARGLGR